MNFDNYFMDTPGERLEVFINQKFTTKREFCRIIGLHENSLNKYAGRNAKSIFGKKYQAKLAELGLNLAWYLTGQGSMIAADTQPAKEVLDSNIKEIDYGPEAPKFRIKYVITPANAGFGYDIADEPDALIEVPYHLYKPHYRAFRVSGDSMTGVGIMNESIIFVDTKAEMLDGKIIVCTVDGILMCKQLRIESNGDRYLDSANPDYKPIKINGFTATKYIGAVIEVKTKFG